MNNGQSPRAVAELSVAAILVEVVLNGRNMIVPYRLRLYTRYVYSSHDSVKQRPFALMFATIFC